MIPLALIALGVAALLMLSKKGGKRSESQAIGTELAGLPEESRNFIMRLLLTDDPANNAEVYASTILQLQGQPFGAPATIARLTEISQERFG